MANPASLFFVNIATQVSLNIRPLDHCNINNIKHSISFCFSNCVVLHHVLKLNLFWNQYFAKTQLNKAPDFYFEKFSHGSSEKNNTNKFLRSMKLNRIDSRLKKIGRWLLIRIASNMRKNNWLDYFRRSEVKRLNWFSNCRPLHQRL